MNQPAETLQPPLKKKKSIVDILNDSSTRQKMKAVMSGYITPEKMVRLCLNAINKTPRLAECSAESLIGAFMLAASLDLEPNTPLGQAYLIPYAKNQPRVDAKGEKIQGADGKWIWEKKYICNFQIGYRGFIDLAYRTDRLLKIEAEAIHENDKFEHQKGSDSFLRFSKKLSDRGELIGGFCYMLVEAKNGSRADISAVLPLEEIHKIRERSETYKTLRSAVNNAKDKDKQKAEMALAETPWVMWEDDMVAKSVIKKAIKQFPLSHRIASAAEIDSVSDSGALDLEAFADPELAKATAEGEAQPKTIEYTPQTTLDMAMSRERERERIVVQETIVDSETGEVLQAKSMPKPTPAASPQSSQQDDIDIALGRFNFGE
jgi:recombination protein RecT